MSDLLMYSSVMQALPAYPRPDSYSSGEVHPRIVCLPGGSVTKSLTPSPGRLLEMFHELRRTFRWSLEFTAAVLGARNVTVQKWDQGFRPITGPTAKMVWLLHDQLMGNGRVKNVWDIATWGRVPCRESLKECLGHDLDIDFTIFLTDAELRKSLRRRTEPAQPEPTDYEI